MSDAGRLRIVGGTWRGRKLSGPPAGLDLRPTADRTRESLFDILVHGRPPFADCTFLDAFCGTGAVALEALSRGAGRAIGFETDRTALELARRNGTALGVGPKTLELKPVDARRPPPTATPADVVFLDPPYRQGLLIPALTGLRAAGWIGAETRLLAEVAAKHEDPEVEALIAGDPAVLPGVRVRRDRRYGAARLVVLESSPALPQDAADDQG